MIRSTVWATFIFSLWLIQNIIYLNTTVYNIISYNHNFVCFDHRYWICMLYLWVRHNNLSKHCQSLIILFLPQIAFQVFFSNIFKINFYEKYCQTSFIYGLLIQINIFFDYNINIALLNVLNLEKLHTLLNKNSYHIY